ncbi:MAG TPA: diguanylate cyclase [Rhodoferax sp.]
MKRWLRRWRLWLLLAVALAATGTSMLAWSLRERQRVQDAELLTLMQQSKAVEDNLVLQLKTINTSLGSIASDIPAWRGDNTGYIQSLHLMQVLAAAIPAAKAFLVTDPQGMVILSNQRVFLGVDAIAEDYVATPRQQPLAYVLYVSASDAATPATPSLRFSRVILDNKLDFDGVVSATMDMQFEGHLLNSLRYADDMQVMLAQQNGKIILGGPQTPPGQSTSLDQLFAQLKPFPGASRVQDASWSNDRHLVVLRTINPPDLTLDKPLQLLLSRSQTAVLANWRTEVREQVLLLVLLTVMGITALRLFERRRTQDIVTTKRLKLATEASGVGIWELDLLTRRYHWDSVMFKLFGLDPKAVSALNDDWQRLLSVDDLDRLREATRQMLRQGQTFKVTFKVTRPDAEERYLQNRATLYVDRNGTPRRLIGTSEDVTAHQQREAEERVAAVAFQSTDSMLVCNATGDILRVNAAFTRLFHYDAAEVIGRSTSILISRRDMAGVFTEGWKALIRDHLWHGELWSRRKDGQDIFCAVSATAVCDDAGQITHFVATHSDITVRKAADDEVKRQAFFDELTGLPNRVLLADRLQQAISQAHRTSGQLALMYIDLDKFKPVNDNYGHAVGDDLLRLVGQRMSACVRETDTVARIGGDEFVVLLPGIEKLQDAISVAEKIHLQLRQPFALTSGMVVSISISSGISLYPTHGVIEDQLSKCADAAMYVAKSKGRDQFCVYSTHMQWPESDTTVASNGSTFPKESPPA